MVSGALPFCHIRRSMDLGSEDVQRSLLLEKFTTVQAALGSPLRTPVVDLSSSQDSSGGPLLLSGLHWWTSPPLRTPLVDLSSPMDSSVVDLSSPQDSSGGPLLWTPVVDLSSPQDSSGGPHLPHELQTPVVDLSSPQDSCGCGESESIRVLQERLCASVNFKNPNMSTCTLERLKRTNPIGLNTSSASQYASTGTRRMAPINGDECFFWRTNGSFYDDKCRFKHKPDQRGRDRKPFVLGQYGWSVTYTTQSICTLKGSTVKLTCSYTYPSGYIVTSTYWFTKYDAKGPVSLSDDPDYKGEYSGRVTYRGDLENGHTLTITDLRERDSATYKFRLLTDQTGVRYYGDPGVTLSVTGLQVKVTGGYQDKTLTCSTTCTLTDNPTYIWYKNGHKVKEDTSSLYSDYFSDADSYSCAVKDHEDLRSPAVCQKCWSVTYTHQSICALKGSTVNISCSYTYPSYHEIKQAFWFTKWSGMEAEDLSSVPGYEGHIEYLGDKESNCTLRITDLRLSDSAGYRFRFITSGGKYIGSPVSLTVTDAVLEMDPTSVSERENVTLTCRTKCTLDPITAYSWYKNGQPIPNSNTYSPVYSLFSVSSEDTGRYSCAVEGHEDLPSAEETLTVTYGPKNTSVSVSPSGEIVEGSSVTLTCSSDANPPVDKYTWYKKNVTSAKASGQSYSITNISSEDRGEYYCEAQNGRGSMNSTALMIIVAGKVTSSIQRYVQ
ncbi:sialoadhesin-like [Salvelinus alpinus]|uniref:sialoadhesin-like n=1 Tax=Salvelinus alpinus TaxID=8036 RepID=UPI0039FC0B71